ncbi:MAG: FecR family protein [Betaproteobacteria bacterium]|jgi:hypothetical protein
MPQHRFSLNGRAAILAAIAAAYPVIGYCAPAAQVDFAVGNVTAVGANGQSRALGKGAKVEQGDTVNTNGGRAQLRFTDGAYVSLQPESQFRIDQYRFEGKQDGNEKGFFSLLKGGLRTITGLVGRSNKANYQVSTSVATIGIRGTEYTIQYGHSITGTVGEGEINVCNGAGCLSVTNGESYYVQSDGVKPVLTNKRTDLPPPEPVQPPFSYVQGNNVDSLGNPIGFSMTGPRILDSALAVFCDCSSPTTQFGVSVVFDANGRLVNFDNTSTTASETLGNDGIIAWGSFVDPSPNGGLKLFVAGVPTDISVLSGKTATYTLLGGTSIYQSTLSGSSTPVGTLNAATMSINFLSGSASGTMSMDMTLQGQARSVSSINVFACGPSLSFNNFSNCGALVNVNGQGFFAGTNAIRAGIAYSVFDNQLSVGGQGVAALKQTSLK